MSMCIMVLSRIGTSSDKWEHMFVYGILNNAPVSPSRQSNKLWNPQNGTFWALISHHNKA